MKEKVKGFICGILVTMMVLSLSSVALAASQTINIEPINVIVNGEVFQPKDVNGNDVLVFVYNGTTYAPLRALAEAYELEVGYDPASNTATVNKPAASTLTLGIGTYTVGSDIPAGKYDVTVLSGKGNFQGKVAACQFGSLNELLAASGDSSGWSSSYSNLTLATGDVLYIKGDLSLQFTKK